MKRFLITFALIFASCKQSTSPEPVQQLSQDSLFVQQLSKFKTLDVLAENIPLTPGAGSWNTSLLRFDLTSVAQHGDTIYFRGQGPANYILIHERALGSVAVEFGHYYTESLDEIKETWSVTAADLPLHTSDSLWESVLQGTEVERASMIRSLDHKVRGPGSGNYSYYSEYFHIDSARVTPASKLTLRFY